MAPEGSETPPELQTRRRVVEWADPKALAAVGRQRSGLAFLQAILAGEILPPPIVLLLGIEMVSAERGRVVMRMAAGEHLYNPLGSIHGGAIATLFDTAMGCAVHSTLDIGRGYTTLEIKVNYLRAATLASGLLTATGEVIHAGRQQAVAEARLHDAAGRLYATASTTCLLFDLPKAPGPAAQSDARTDRGHADG